MHSLQLFLFLLPLGVVCAASFSRLASHIEVTVDQNNLRDFYGFVDRFGRSYATADEVLRRFRIFEENQKEIEAFRKDQPHARFGITKFADFTLEEKKQMVMRNPPSELQNLVQRSLAESKDSIPESVDWREKGIVTNVKDQGNCGSCWTFGSAAIVESAWAKAGNKPVNISEQQILDCEILLNDGCDGGTHVFTMNYAHDHGLVRMEDYEPYHASKSKCDNSAKLKVREFHLLPHDEKKIAEWVALHDPVAISESSIKLFQTREITYNIEDFRVHKSLYDYTDGVYHPTNCAVDTVGYHVVAIVGYGVHNGEDVWIVKNSWGTGWGNLGGYFYMARGHNVCEMDAWVVAIDSFQ